MPSEIAPKKTISVLIYGQPSTGKTTLACSASNAVLFDYDGGVNRINPAHLIPTLQVESWEDTFAALDMIEGDPQFRSIQTIIIDTCGKMLDYMSEYIMRTNPKMKQYDGTLSLKGYGVRKKMFTDFVHQLAIKGKNVIFVAHETEVKSGEDTIKRPLVGGSSAADLIQELDLVGYMAFKGRKRTISFNPSDDYYAKNSCYIPDTDIPECVDAQGNVVRANTFMEDAVFGAFRKAQQNKVEMNKRYNDLVNELNSIIAEVSSLDALNEALKSIAKMPVIYDSKIKAGMALNAKAQTLGAKYDAKSKTYVAA